MTFATKLMLTFWTITILAIGFFIGGSVAFDLTEFEHDALQEKIETYAFCDSLDQELWLYMEDWKKQTVFVCTLKVTDDRVVLRRVGVHWVYIINKARFK